MMYFDKPTQQDIVQRLSGCLEPGGYLFVGHSESLTGVAARLALCPARHLSQEKSQAGALKDVGDEIAGGRAFRIARSAGIRGAC